MFRITGGHLGFALGWLGFVLAGCGPGERAGSSEHVASGTAELIGGTVDSGPNPKFP